MGAVQSSRSRAGFLGWICTIVSDLAQRVGLASFGYDAAQTRQSPRELDNQGVVFFCWRSPWPAVVLDHLCGVKNLNYAQGESSYHVQYCVDAEVSTRQIHRIPIATSGSGYTRKRINYFDAVIHMPESSRYTRFIGRMKLILSCGSPNASRCFTLGARSICLVSENPTCSVPEF